MNSERRHELQENELAAHLSRINKAIEPYSKLIAVVLAAVVLGVIAMALYQSKASGDRSDATLRLIDASISQDPTELKQIAASYPNTSAAAWARLYEANALLTESMQKLFVDRPSAEDTIRQARASYNTALSMSDDRILRSRCHFGLARASEALGEIETAIREYQETVAANESDSMVALAERRIASLESPDTQAFVDWFAEQDFSPVDPSAPPELPSSASLSESPDISVPPLNLSSDEDDPKELDGDGIEMPADEDIADEDTDSTNVDAEKADTERAEAAEPDTDQSAKDKTDDEAAASDDE